MEDCMRIVSYFGIGLLGLLVSHVACAGGYFGFRVGGSDVNETEVIDKYDTTGFGSAYVGAYRGPIRAEVEYSVLGKAKYEGTKTNVQFQRVMANGYVDLNVTRYVRPYIGGGVGTAFYKMDEYGSTHDETGTSFAWNATAGVGIRLTRNVTFDSGYRYVDMGDVTVKNDELHFGAQEVYAGLRFLF